MLINISFYLDSGETPHEYQFSIFNETFIIRDTETGKQIQFPCRTLYDALLHHGLIPDLQEKWDNDRQRYRSVLAVIRAGVENASEIARKALQD